MHIVTYVRQIDILRIRVTMIRPLKVYVTRFATFLGIGIVSREAPTAIFNLVATIVPPLQLSDSLRCRQADPLGKVP